MPCERFFYQCIDLRFARHIAIHISGLQLSGQSLPRCLVHIGQHHLRTLARKALRTCRANALGSARNDHHLAL